MKSEAAAKIKLKLGITYPHFRCPLEMFTNEVSV